MLISVVDDNIKELDLIYDLINEELKRLITVNDFYIERFSDPNLVNLDTPYKIMFLDIDMPINGIEFAKKYISIHQDTYIIFITNRVDLVFNAFDVHPYHFIRKSELSSLLPAVIGSLVKKVEIENETITIKTKLGYIKINLSDIKYIQSQKHYCIIKTELKEFRVREKLLTIYIRINNKNFCRIHNTCIINWQYVDKFDDTMIKIKKKYFSVSKSKLKDTKQSYLDYISSKL